MHYLCFVLSTRQFSCLNFFLVFTVFCPNILFYCNFDALILTVFFGSFLKNKLQQELAAIFKKIGEKQTCTIGLYELYRITQLYPKVKN